MGIGALQSPLFALVFSTAFLAGSLFVARQTLSHVSRRRRHALFDLLDRLSEHVTDGESSDAEQVR